MAVQAGVPIIPVVIATYSSIFHLHSSTFEAGTVKVKGTRPLARALLHVVGHVTHFGKCLIQYPQRICSFVTLINCATRQEEGC
jgi:hypothetical protein